MKIIQTAFMPAAAGLRGRGHVSVLLLLLALAGCGASNPPEPSEGHIQADDKVAEAALPEPVLTAPPLAPPQPREALETYTVVVNQVPVRELLFSMARDAKLNLDIANGIEGKITMNAIDQTLPKILDRISEMANITYRLEGDTLKVRPDVPVLRSYDVHYLNIERSSTGKVSVSTEIGTAGTDIQKVGSSGGNAGGSAGAAGDNKAKTSVKNSSDNRFWTTLEENIARILDRKDKSRQALAEGKHPDIIINRESGTIAVRATARQHEKIAAFIHRVVTSAQRQVLIEATIAEVRLSDEYQSGVDWSVVGETATVNGQSVLRRGGIQSLLGGNLASTPFFQLAATGSINGNPLDITLKALETFGDVKVLSSPKVMALNNQTAILKVVDNEVFFTTNVQIDPGTVNQNSTSVIDTSINTVPIGIIMSVTPYIDGDDEVTLNIRPTITRIIRFVNDPNPELAKQNVVSRIPVIQVREIETMLKIHDKDTAVIGGLMQDQVDKSNTGVPILSSIPLLGRLFSYDEEEYVKTELVIFIRPVVMHEASLDGDLAAYRKYLDVGIEAPGDKDEAGATPDEADESAQEETP